MDAGYERILDMAKRAGLKGRDELYLSPAEMEFAQSIIAECVKICEAGTATQTTSSGAAHMIRQHFGVK